MGHQTHLRGAEDVVRLSIHSNFSRKLVYVPFVDHTGFHFRERKQWEDELKGWEGQALQTWAPQFHCMTLRRASTCCFVILLALRPPVPSCPAFLVTVLYTRHSCHSRTSYPKYWCSRPSCRLGGSTCLVLVTAGKRGTIWGMLSLMKSLCEVELSNLQLSSTLSVASWRDYCCRDSYTSLILSSREWCRYALRLSRKAPNSQVASLLEICGLIETKVRLSKNPMSKSCVCSSRTLV